MPQTNVEQTIVRKKSAFLELMGYHGINIKLGAFCALLTLILLYCLLTNKQFRKKRKLIITLAVADFLNCIGILLMGIDRFSLYESIVHTGHANSETSWSCAQHFWLLVKTAGDVWPPIVQCFMGTEQLLSVCGKWQSKRRADLLVVASFAFTVIVLTVGYMLAFSSRFDGNVKYYCGRKATFGMIFSGFVYAHNVVGYVSGVVLNSVALRQKESKANTFCVDSKDQDRQIQQIRSCLIVSSISTILVSIPNCLSLFSLLIASVRDSISKPAVWATCINSGVNLFVYIVLDRDFRQHVTFLWKREEYSAVCPQKEEEEHVHRLLNQYDSRTETFDSNLEERVLNLKRSLSSEFP
ncbi:hypothetical protein Y032_0279g1205 [Ancylostoma ceylanicum]|nr:hypothetical protein Y032_0279g1205 [Ancylostoma ceylanicum]